MLDDQAQPENPPAALPRAQRIDVEIVGSVLRAAARSPDFSILASASGCVSRPTAATFFCWWRPEVERRAIAAGIDPAACRAISSLPPEISSQRFLASETAGTGSHSENVRFAQRDGALSGFSCPVIIRNSVSSRRRWGRSTRRCAGRSLKVRLSISRPIAKPLVNPSNRPRSGEPLGHGIVICAVWVCFSLACFNSLHALIARLGFALARLRRGRDPLLLALQVR